MAGLISTVFAELGDKTAPAGLALAGVLVGIWMHIDGCPVVVAVAGLGFSRSPPWPSDGP